MRNEEDSIFVAANGWVGRLPQFKAGCWHSCSRNSTLFVVKASTDYTFRSKWEYNYRRDDENEGRRACATLHSYAYLEKLLLDASLPEGKSELSGKELGIPSLEKAKVRLYDFSSKEFVMTPTEISDRYTQVPLTELLNMLTKL